MSVISGKKIILGVSGGIAAYKTASLIRLLIKAGAQVQVVMTPASKSFITPLTLSVLSKRPVYSSFFSENNTTESEWNNHIDLALWADLILIAPATANTIAKMANGLCNNLLLGIYLSAQCPVFVAPAMDLDMYIHPTTKKNLSLLKEYGNTIIPAECGELASGLIGEGRMAEPENIFRFLENHFSNHNAPFRGKKVLITAGPTYEAIDPVRFIGNHSSGKMGYAIAEEFANQGAEVYLVSGPSNLNIANENIKIVRVQSADEMFKECNKNFHQMDIFVSAAAVADYKPLKAAEQKIKKQESASLQLVKNVDILGTLSAQKEKQFVVGFALETQDEMNYAKDKLKRKNLDLIVLNSLNDKGAGFGVDTNKVTIIDKDYNVYPFELMSKKNISKEIVNLISKLI